jgi:hypothetical protein
MADARPVSSGGSTLLMHRTHLNELLRDAAIAHAIRPAIERGGLTFAQTRDALTSLNIPRAAMIAVVLCPKVAT